MNRSKQAGMGKKTIVILLLGLTLASVHLAEAQQPKKLPKIGFLSSGGEGSPAWRESFAREFGKLGYFEGKNVAFEFRNANTRYDRLPALAKELVRLKVDVIVTPGSNDTRAAKNATKTIPIVFTGAGSDPVTLGLVESLARPGGNVTGFAQIAAQLAGKRLELLRKPFPNSLGLRLSGIRRMPARRRFGKKANGKHKSWACSSIL